MDSREYPQVRAVWSHGQPAPLACVPKECWGPVARRSPRERQARSELFSSSLPTARGEWHWDGTQCAWEPRGNPHISPIGTSGSAGRASSCWRRGDLAHACLRGGSGGMGWGDALSSPRVPS